MSVWSTRCSWTSPRTREPTIKHRAELGPVRPLSGAPGGRPRGGVAPGAPEPCVVSRRPLATPHAVTSSRAEPAASSLTLTSPRPPRSTACAARFEEATGVGLAPVSPTKPLIGWKPLQCSSGRHLLHPRTSRARLRGTPKCAAMGEICPAGRGSVRSSHSNRRMRVTRTRRKTSSRTLGCMLLRVA